MECFSFSDITDHEYETAAHRWATLVRSAWNTSLWILVMCRSAQRTWDFLENKSAYGRRDQLFRVVSNPEYAAFRSRIWLFAIFLVSCVSWVPGLPHYFPFSSPKFMTLTSGYMTDPKRSSDLDRKFHSDLFRSGQHSLEVILDMNVHSFILRWLLE